MSDVRSNVESLCRELARQAYREAIGELREIETRLSALGDSDRCWYVPKTFDSLSQGTAHLRQSLHPERYFPSLEVLGVSPELLKEIDKAYEKARKNRVRHKNDTSSQLVEIIVGASIPLGILGGIVGAIAGGISERYTAGQGFMIGLLLPVAIGALVAYAKVDETKSREFIKDKFKDQ